MSKCETEYKLYESDKQEGKCKVDYLPTPTYIIPDVC